MSGPERRALARRTAGIACIVALAMGAGVADAAAGGGPPGEGFAPGWKASEPPRTFVSQDLFNYIDGAAELFLEFGFIRLVVQRYGDGASELTAAVYEMESATAALGLYLMKMGNETPFPEIAARNSSEEAQMTILKGRHLVQIDNFADRPASRAIAVSLANALLAPLADEKPAALLDRLPAEGRVAGSERLIRGPYGLQPYLTFGEGDILRLGGKIYAALADYTAPDGSRYRRLIVAYPDAAVAAAALEGLRANPDPESRIVARTPDGFTFVDFQKKYGAVARTGNVLELRFRMASPD